MSLDWPPGPFLYNWSPHPEKRDLIPPTELVVYAPDGEHARAVAFLMAALAIRASS